MFAIAIKQVVLPLPSRAVGRLTPPVSLLHSTCRRQRPRVADGPGLRDFISANSVAAGAQIATESECDSAPYLREEDLAGHGRKGMAATLSSVSSRVNAHGRLKVRAKNRGARLHEEAT